MTRCPLNNGLLRLVAASMLLASQGCAGLFGYTSTFTVDLDTPPPVHLRSITLEPNRNRSVVVGAYDWGDYDQDDLNTLAESIRDSLPKNPRSTQADLHVVIRRMLTSYSNQEGFVIACVTWALAQPDGRKFHEQFYASKYAYMSTTAGGIKNTIHQAIAERILRTAAEITETPNADIKPYPAQHTYQTFEEATVGIPRSISSLNISTLILGGGYYWKEPTTTRESGRSFAREKDHFDWDDYLAQPDRSF